MTYQVAIFDLDGTLIDSLEDIADSVNETLTDFNLPTHSLSEFKYFVGNGARKLIERSIPSDKLNVNYVNKLLNHYDEVYKNHLTIKTKPYAGIKEMIAKFKSMKIPLAVCTNKQNFAAQIIVNTLFADTFDFVSGDIDGSLRKPNPTRALKIAEQFGVAPQNVAYFGDTAIDMETAHNANFLSIGVTWGFRPKSELIESGADILVDNPNEIFNRIFFKKIVDKL